MSNIADTSEEWELSKENIKPIQQGRKQNVLKVALGSHPEEILAQQQQLFENELRTYSGDDPLSVWCKYIKWVEQNYPKGGREGHIKKLLEHCLSILKNEKRYFDDDRFIDILLKYANLSGKPIEIYNYMAGSNIGCQSAKFFINWSWELEQLGNLKKADEILTEGMNRRAQPFEEIKAYREDFQIRLVNKVKESSEKIDLESDNSRSAFSVLKPQRKNLAPVMRTGDAVIENRPSLILRRQQPQPKSTLSSGKVPFKIYNSENINPLHVIQPQPAARSGFSLENFKENEQKAIKWNKHKVRSHSLKTPSEANPDFKFHCDEENDLEIQTPRSVPKTSNILSSRRRTPSPPIALFEPEDPLKKPMYPKHKVYMGAMEYSFEEIRAAEWREKIKKAEQERLLQEHQRKIEEQSKQLEEKNKQIELLAKQVQILQSKFSNPAISNKQDNPLMNAVNNCEKHKFKNNELNEFQLNKFTKQEAIAKNSKISSYDANSSSQKKSFTQLKENLETLPLKKGGITETIENKCPESSTYYEKIIQELYNKSLFNSTGEDETKTLNKVSVINALNNNDKLSFMFYQDPTEGISDLHAASANECVKENTVPSLSASNETLSILKESNKVPFSLFHDSIENLSCPSADKFLNNDLPNVSKEMDNKLPFSLYHDFTSDLSKENKINHSTSLLKQSKLPFDVYNDFIEEKHSLNEVPPVEENENKIIQSQVGHEESSEEDTENIPPKDYVQENNKRQLAGVLQPSTNVLFIPLEEQELDEESDVEDDPMVQNEHHTDDTFIAPSNTEQFSSAKFLASTPYVPRNSQSSELEKSDHEITSSVKKITLHNPEILDSVKKSFAIDEKTHNKIEINSARESLPVTEVRSSCFSRLPNRLSVIMEASSENYSKSSSSSSSASLTKSNNLEQFSVQHFSLHKNVSKLETSEANTVNSVYDIQLYQANFDPFDKAIIQKCIDSIDINSYKNIYHVKKYIRGIKPGENISIGDSQYIIESLIAEGGYAKVYKAQKPILNFTNDDYLNHSLALKVCKKGNEWEFYVCCEIRKRLTRIECLPSIQNSIINVKGAIRYIDGIVLVSKYHCFGTILDIVNYFKKKNSAIPELVTMYFTLEMLHIVSNLHKCNIIHCDIKPDNFLLPNDFEDDVLGKMSETTSLTLTDFGRAIDLNLYDKGVCFTTIFESKALQCIEMKDKKPWVFQLDWYGVVSCIYIMLFSEYMKVKKSEGVWGIEKKFKRYWFTSLWEPLFQKLLNIPNCYEEPDISPFVTLIETKLQQNANAFRHQLSQLSNAYSEKL